MDILSTLGKNISGTIHYHMKESMLNIVTGFHSAGSTKQKSDYYFFNIMLQGSLVDDSLWFYKKLSEPRRNEFVK